ncbi:MAG: lipopolysaccharide kinase InaA family protein [Azoarcus sp.]|jgi:tRNA A-37 threonylcarbamoyl transferase component Bud32|nr:lipopolysaccharide kinase InaA family protein [Azoarcus sp.]
MSGAAPKKTEQVPFSTAVDLVAARRAPPCPCVLLLDESGRLDLLRLLRVLPGKRIVGEGLWNGQRVLAKLFIAAGSVRHWRRERDGLTALAEAGVPTTQLLAAGTFAGGGRYLLTAFVPDAHSLTDELATGNADVNATLQAACACIGLLHGHGLVHNDMHPGNFLIGAGAVRLIDGDAVRRRATPLPAREANANLAQFLAELPQDVPLAVLLAAYRDRNEHHAPAPAVLAPLIVRQRQRLLADYLCKTLRPCTLVDVRHDFRRFTAVARHDAARFEPLLADPDQVLATAGAPFKDGGTATVARVDYDGMSLVIKRYNIKNNVHAFSRAWRPSRAWHAWRAGHRLHFLGIDTPLPRALIEERLGPLRRRAWLVTDFHPGRNLIEHLAPYVEAAAPPQAEGEALLQFVAMLHVWRISHGDFKATNLLWDEARRRIAVIDLDAMTRHASAYAYARAWRRDRARLLANWPAGSGLRCWLDEHLPPNHHQ